MPLAINPDDVKVLRELATKVRDYAHHPDTHERRSRWLAHNALKPGKPMVLAEVGGLAANGEYPIEPMLVCHEKWARDLERSLRDRIYQFEVMRDDWVIEPSINIAWQISNSGYGVSAPKHSGTHDGIMGSYVWEAPLKNLGDDLARLRPRTFTVNREATLA